MSKNKYRFNEKEDGYHMPDGYEDENGRVVKEKRDAVLTARYQEEEQLKTEQELWEEKIDQRMHWNYQKVSHLISHQRELKCFKIT